MKIAIIPARGKSVRIKNKNIKKFFNKSIIKITYEILKKSKIFDQIILTTDDKNIIDKCKNYGFDKIIQRPSKLGKNHISTEKVVRHAISILEAEIKISTVCCVYPCNPFLKKDTILKAYTMLKKKFDFIFPILSFPVPIQQAVNIKKNRLNYLYPNLSKHNTQFFKKSYYDAGQFYLAKKFCWNSDKKIIKGIELPKYSTVDIDTMEDWIFAEKLYKINN
jgi:pseudaminic acid cytidylyltransferase|tara:strand:+ start:14 stop:676 length:663 start_codon:yes stop_codon:yes gene_type:complete